MQESTFWILTAVAPGRRHGYAILREVSDLSCGAVVLRPTTLYASLERLLRDELLEEAGSEVVGGRARHYYDISPSGRTALEEESAAMAARARIAADRLTTQTAASRPASGAALGTV